MPATATAAAGAGPAHGMAHGMAHGVYALAHLASLIRPYPHGATPLDKLWNAEAARGNASWQVRQLARLGLASELGAMARPRATHGALPSTTVHLPSVHR